VKCGLVSSGSGYAEHAGCSANAKEMRSYANGVEHFHLFSKNHSFKKGHITPDNLYLCA
jgi:hypothetical protein